MPPLLGQVRPAIRIGLVFVLALLVAPFVAHQVSKVRHHVVSDEIATQEARSHANYRLDLPQVKTISLPAPFVRHRDHAAPPSPSCPDSAMGIIACWRYPGRPAVAAWYFNDAMAAAGFDPSPSKCERLPADPRLDPHPGLACKVTSDDRGHQVELVAVPHLVFPKLPPRPTPGHRPHITPGKAVGSEITLVIL